MGSPSSGGGKGAKGGSSGHASNAALDSDEDLMFRRRVQFDGWKAKKKKPEKWIDYPNSPAPDMRLVKRT